MTSRVRANFKRIHCFVIKPLRSYSESATEYERFHLWWNLALDNNNNTMSAVDAEILYHPSKWTKRLPADIVVAEHIKFIADGKC